MMVSVLMTILFTIALIGFLVTFAGDNNAVISIDQDSDIDSLDITTRSGMSTFNNESEEVYSSIVNTTIEPGSDVIKSPAAVSLWWGNLFNSFKNIVTVGYGTIFGYGSVFGVFLSALLGIMGALFVLYIIKAWRGNP